MKNKRTLYVLIPLVALIWGVVIWKVFAYRPAGPVEDIPNYTSTVSEESDTSRYELIVNYRDPFLRGATRTVQKSEGSVAKRKNNVKNIEISSVHGTPRPNGLVYRGLIAGPNDRVGLLELGSVKLLVEEDSMLEEYRILSVESDTLRIEYQEKVFAYGKE